MKNSSTSSFLKVIIVQDQAMTEVGKPHISSFENNWGKYVARARPAGNSVKHWERRLWTDSTFNVH